jgi:hypothetical protein
MPLKIKFIGINRERNNLMKGLKDLQFNKFKKSKEEKLNKKEEFNNKNNPFKGDIPQIY